MKLVASAILEKETVSGASPILERGLEERLSKRVFGPQETESRHLRSLRNKGAEILNRRILERQRDYRH